MMKVKFGTCANVCKCVKCQLKGCFSQPNQTRKRISSEAMGPLESLSCNKGHAGTRWFSFLKGKYNMSGDIAWLLISAALVLFMTPGLAFFYGGLVKRKNVISTMMICVFIMGMASIMWVLFGYSLSF